jgi:hypothetical protein
VVDPLRTSLLSGRQFLAYQINRRASIEEVVDADPVATRLRDVMVQSSQWAGSASALLHMGTVMWQGASSGGPNRPAHWPGACGALRRGCEHWESK